MNNFTPCRVCGKKQIPKNKPLIPKGFFYDTVTKNGIEYSIVKECECHKKWSDNNQIFLKFKKRGFDEKLFDFNWDTVANKFKYEKRIETYLEKFEDIRVRSSILYFYSNSDTRIRKQIANYIAKQLLYRGYECNYIEMNDLFKKLQMSNTDSDSSVKEELRDEISILEDCDLLVIDNAFEKEKSQWGGHFGNFMRSRINNNKGILFISSTLISDISKVNLKYYYDESIKNFIADETDKRKSVFFFDPEVTIPEVLF